MLVFGHRGACAYAPENTLPAFELALTQGADGIELDVHLTADKYPVVIHDYHLEKTTDGAGRVAAHTLQQLKQLDAGAWFHPDFSGTRIPTLDEVFAAVGDKLIINVEIKARESGAAWVVADTIRRHNMQARVIVSSFNPFTLRQMRRALPTVDIGFLYEQKTAPLTRRMLFGIEYQAHHPHHTMIDGGYMLTVKSAGYRVNTWTVNDPERARLLRDYGVDVVITDAPDVILAGLGRG